jgi:hypothetical protein
MLTAAQYLGLRYLHRQFASTSAHKNYDNSIAEWLGYGIDEFRADDPEYANMPIVRLPYWDGRHKNELQQAFQPLESFVEQHRNKCNTIFQMDVGDDEHFAPLTLYYVKSSMVDKYRKARAIDNMPLDFYNSDHDVMNLAIYMRNGDFSPTSESWLVSAAEMVQEVLYNHPYPIEWNVSNEISRTTLSLPIHIHVFAFMRPSIAKIGNNENVTFHINDPVKTTLHHLINADIVVRSASSFVEVAAMASTRPLFIHPPTREKLLRWEACYPAGICLGPEHFNNKLGLDPLQIQAILEFRYKWWLSKRKEKERKKKIGE